MEDTMVKQIDSGDVKVTFETVVYLYRQLRSWGYGIAWESIRNDTFKRNIDHRTEMFLENHPDLSKAFDE